MDIGFGIAGTVPGAVVRGLAPELERLGYHTLWINDTPQGDSLARIADAMAVTRTLRVASGVIPIDRKPGPQIAEDVVARGLDLTRLGIGIGSGRAEHPLRAVEDAEKAIRERLGDGAWIAVAALGPRMTELAARIADEILFNWLTPEGAKDAAGRADSVARRLGSRRPRVASYARVAMSPGGRQRAGQEADRYAEIPSYAANFARLGVTAADTLILGEDSDDIHRQLNAFAGALDEVVVRAITAEERLDDYLEIAHAAAPQRPAG